MTNLLYKRELTFDPNNVYNTANLLIKVTIVEPIFEPNVVVMSCKPIDLTNLPNTTLSRLHPNGKISCACCSRKATHVVEWRYNKQKAKHVHANFFSQDSTTGVMTLMTKDHILPKSMGGPGWLINLRAMCQVCNMARANHIGNRELIQSAVNLSNISKKQARDFGLKRRPARHPLHGWLAILDRFPQLENAVHFT